jgi:hypothetical protein
MIPARMAGKADLPDYRRRSVRHDASPKPGSASPELFGRLSGDALRAATL